MSVEILIMGLAGLTLIAALTFVVTSKKQVEDRIDSDDVPKSSLARDGDSHRAVRR